ncbi:2-phosphoglycerate kinase [Porphyridium purpureum]|uniref:2-phosphoglycerate kinase n=1 Tax=Porphyridium purpureum TaxID=35688 RepID=A0A5J4YTA1_PORPP|nr:2-phosphoglycerate kinase [Porphyridium purpureum]|eukprot:POR5769..scf236_6
MRRAEAMPMEPPLAAPQHHQQPPVAAAARKQLSRFGRGSSRYDYVKVRVWIDGHYHVLSRFLLTRLLCMCRVPSKTALRVALDLKKRLVDERKFDLSHTELQSKLFELMAEYGCSTAHCARYSNVIQFYHKRVPIIILVGGVCVPAAFALQLAARLNISALIRTDYVFDMLCATAGSPGPGCAHHAMYQHIWAQPFASKQELVAAFREQAERVRCALRSEFNKALTDGKSLIVEGIHVDPEMYLDLVLSSGVGTERPETQAEVPHIGVPIVLSMAPGENAEPWYLLAVHERLNFDVASQNMSWLNEHFEEQAAALHALHHVMEVHKSVEAVEVVHELVMDTLESSFACT